jgi:hypothetical protein
MPKKGKAGKAEVAFGILRRLNVIILEDTFKSQPNNVFYGSTTGFVEEPVFWQDYDKRKSLNIMNLEYELIHIYADL